MPSLAQTRLLPPPKFLPQAANLGVIVIGELALVGWVVNNASLKGVYPGLAEMNPTTALTFIVASVAFRLLFPELVSWRRQWLRRGLGELLAAAVALVGLLKLCEYAFGLRLGVDQVLFHEQLGLVRAFAPNRIAPNTALCITLLGLALALLDVTTKGGRRPAEYLTLVAGLVSAMAVLGYAYGMSVLVSFANFAPMPLNTAMAFVLLCLAILSARCEHGLMRIFLADSFGGELARRLFPAAIVLPVLLGWLRLEGERAGLFDASFGVAVMATANIVFFVVLLYWTAASLDQSDLERQQAEQARLEAEERFRVLVTGVKDYAIFMLDPKGRVTSWNDGAQRIKGYTADEIVGRHFTRFFTPEDIRDDKPERELRTAEIEGRAEDEGWRVRRDGSRFWANVVVTPLRDDVGKLRGFSKVTRDITERKKVEEALRAAEEKFRVVSETAADAIVSADSRGNITYFNKAAEIMFGHAAAEALGQPLTLLMPQRFQEAYRRGLERYLTTGETHVVGRQVELTGHRKDGTEFPLELSLASWKTKDGTFFTGILRDITRRKEAEAALEAHRAELARSNQELTAANKELDAFTYSVSHDLRSPLRQIDGFARILQEEAAPQLTTEERHCLERIQEGVGKMGRLVDDLLNLGRVGRKQLSWEHTRLNALVKEAITELEPETQARTIDWRIDDLPAIKCDPGLMKLVFVNLLSNAIKFSQQADRPVIQVGHKQVDGETVFFVRDNGIGFNMRYVSKLFGIFQRLHRQEDFPGTGVGLASVQRIIHKHGGRVWAESEPYKGASFYFTLGQPDRSESEVSTTLGGAKWPLIQ